MFSESKITAIYCMADDFCKEFALQQEKYMLENSKQKHRNKPNHMSDAEDYGYSYSVSFWRFPLLQALLQRVYVQISKTSISAQVSYNCFVELEKEILLLLNYFASKNLLGTCMGIGFVDSMPLHR